MPPARKPGRRLLPRRCGQGGNVRVAVPQQVRRRLLAGRPGQAGVNGALRPVADVREAPDVWRHGLQRRGFVAAKQRVVVVDRPAIGWHREIVAVTRDVAQLLGEVALLAVGGLLGAECGVGLTASPTGSKVGSKGTDCERDGRGHVSR